MRLSESEKYGLDKLSQSRYFTSAKDVELLRYLIESTQEGKNLKETLIAIEFFGKDATFDSGSDSIVRSNIYNLRKKLDAYYMDEGSNDAVRFIIPKGAYQVKFEMHEPAFPESSVTESRVKNGNLLKTLLTISVVLTVVFALLYFNSVPQKSKSAVDEAGPVWSYYVQSPNTVMIVLGDYFMMQNTKTQDSTYAFMRNPHINNQTDFFNYLEKYPDQKTQLKTLGQSYFGEEIPQCFFQILQIFQLTQKAITVKYASELTLTDIRENDVIFIGDYGTMQLLKPFFEKSGYRYSNTSNTIYLLDEQQDTTEYYYLANPNQSVFQNDYASVVSVTSYPGKRALFLTSFLPFGKSEALYKLQDANFLTELSDSAIQLPNEWSLLMKISGLQSSGFYYEVLNFTSHLN